MTASAPYQTACPNCGATIRFLWAQAVQTTCPYCRSILVRRDLDLERVGEQADFPATGSPIQIGVDGKWRQRAFTVVGRIAYAYDRGRWNEWHCRMGDGTSAWLSDAQLEYAMTQRVDAGDFSQWQRLTPGEWIPIGNQRYEVSTLTRAHYLGVEGELPFTTWTREECLFLDLQNQHGAIATIDTTDDPPSVYVGEFLDFADLSLRGLREFEGWTLPAASRT